MANNLPETRKETPIDRLKTIMSSESVQQQFKNALSDNAPLFVASLIDLYGGDNYLQKCEPKDVVMEALKAATLKLPINKSLGFAWIVPYAKSKKITVTENGKEKEKWTKEIHPTFQIGWKGFIQLAIRTGQYRYINADVVREGELLSRDKLTGEIDMSGTATSDKVVGYFAYLETVNGFKKTVFSTVEEVKKHAERFSKSYKDGKSAWATDFDAMALKTMIRALFSKYGIMSVEMVRALDTDTGDEERPWEGEANQGEVIDITAEDVPPPVTEEEPPY